MIRYGWKVRGTRVRPVSCALAGFSFCSNFCHEKCHRSIWQSHSSYRLTVLSRCGLRLDSYIVLLSIDGFPQAFAENFTPLIGVFSVNDDTQSVHHFTIQPDIELDQIRCAQPAHLIVKAAISLGDALESVEKVEDDFAQGQIISH